MASFSHDYQRASSSQRRDSLGRSSTRQRPRLLRSSATEPSITASNAIRGSCVNPASPHRATDILSKVAVYSMNTVDITATTATELLSSTADSILMIPDDNGQAHDAHGVEGCGGSPPDHSGCYFSFPSFDVWDRSKQVDSKGCYD